MKIAVNARFLIKNKTEGIGRFTFEIFKLLTSRHPEVTFYFLFDRPFSSDFIVSDNIKPVVLPPPARHPFLWYLWFEISVKRFLKKSGVNIFVSPDGFIPLNTKTKTLSVIHDLNFEHRPKDIPWLTRTYYKHYFPKFASRSTRIVTVSEFSKNDIVNNYRVHPDKIDIVHNGVSQVFVPTDFKNQQHIRQKMTGGKPFFLYVGAIHQRKNIANLLVAFEQFCNHSESEFRMILTGKSMFGNKKMQSVYNRMTHKNKVIFTGWLTDVELRQVMASAYALTFIPYFEGFGIPIIEAMKCGVPVISSNVTSLPEVAGDAALLVNPHSHVDICNAMLRIADDKKLKNDMISRGLKKSNEYSWSLAASKMWESITKCMNENE